MVFLWQTVAFLWKPCLCLCTFTVSTFCVFTPSEKSLFSLCLHPCPPNCWGYLLRPSRREGPLAHHFSFASTLHPKQNVEYLLYLSRGGEKLDGVSSTSLPGVGPGLLGKPLFFPLEIVGFPLANCCSFLGSPVYACALTL